MVEAAGIEPASEEGPRQASTRLAASLYLAPCTRRAGEQGRQPVDLVRRQLGRQPRDQLVWGCAPTQTHEQIWGDGYLVLSGSESVIVVGACV